jgi:hypothetical protein
MTVAVLRPFCSLSDVMLCVIMLAVVMIYVNILNVTMLSVFILSVIMLRVNDGCCAWAILLFVLLVCRVSLCFV